MASGQRINTDNIGALASGKKLTEDDAKQAIPFKICLVGNAAVGKSCIVDRYINDNFANNSAATLSAEFFTKVLTVSPPGYPPAKIKMQIWDTAGAEQYRSLTKLYYQKAAVVILVYSMNDYESLDQLSHWAQEVEENAHKNTIKIVVCAKSDNVEDDEVVPK